MQITLLNVDEIKTSIHVTPDRDSFFVKGRVSLFVYSELDLSMQNATDEEIKQAFIDKITKALQAIQEDL